MARMPFEQKIRQTSNARRTRPHQEWATCGVSRPHSSVLSPVPPSSFAAAPPPSLPTSVLQALREATAAQHAQLDTGLAIAHPDASLHDYGVHAQALAAWLQALSPHLKSLQTSVYDFEFAPADRLAALQADLQDMAPTGAEATPLAWPAPSAATQQHIARALAHNPTQAESVCWGLVYVIEGSQLGGQVLYRHLAPRLAPHPLRYLQGRASSTGARWKSFVSLLQQHVASPAAIAACCHGAQAAFEGLQHHFWETEGMST